MRPGRRTYVTLAVMAVAAFVLISISGISRFKNAKHGADEVIGAIGWFGGCLTALAFLILLLRTIWIARRGRRQEQASLSAS
jgi:hypothetical protein